MTTRSRTRRLTWILVGSIIVGVVASFLLALFVFDGGTESTITGALMLGDGLGWSLIALLTGRYTDHPQRWTWVPAAGMTAIGLLLVGLEPGATTMSHLSWVWPPVLLIFVAWMRRTVLRSPAPSGRWVINVVIVFYLVCAVGTTYQNVADHRDRNTYAAPGRTYEVDGHRLHLLCKGQGRPTVVLQNGLGEISASWTRIIDGLAPIARVCAFDRAGQGWSRSAGAQPPRDEVADLHAVLEQAGETGPFVLVGHSTGGTYTMAYAHQFPTEVAGLVLLDSATPEQFTALSAYPAQYSAMRRGLALEPTFARFGLVRVVAAVLGSKLPAPAAAEVAAVTSTARAASNVRDEISVLPELFDLARRLRTVGGRPLVVLTASDSLSTQGWAQAQDKLAELSTNRLHRTVQASHAGLLEEEPGSSESIRAIAEVLDSVRHHTQLTTGTR